MLAMDHQRSKRTDMGDPSGANEEPLASISASSVQYPIIDFKHSIYCLRFLKSNITSRHVTTCMFTIIHVIAFSFTVSGMIPGHSDPALCSMRAAMLLLVSGDRNLLSFRGLRQCYAIYRRLLSR